MRFLDQTDNAAFNGAQLLLRGLHRLRLRARGQSFSGFPHRVDTVCEFCQFVFEKIRQGSVAATFFTAFHPRCQISKSCFELGKLRRLFGNGILWIDRCLLRQRSHAVVQGFEIVAGPLFGAFHMLDDIAHGLFKRLIAGVILRLRFALCGLCNLTAQHRQALIHCSEGFNGLPLVAVYAVQHLVQEFGFC